MADNGGNRSRARARGQVPGDHAVGEPAGGDPVSDRLAAGDYDARSSYAPARGHGTPAHYETSGSYAPVGGHGTPGGNTAGIGYGAGDGDAANLADLEDPADDTGYEAQPELVPPSVMAWWRHLGRRSLRPDRSPSIDREPRGRLDRLDLWFLVLIVIVGLTMRIYRLDEPTGMHFDEVYHARTGAEFLQDWRYNIPHDIYEWTHPHFAKYAIAGGMYAFSDDQVKATSDLGVPVQGAAIETRLEPTDTKGDPRSDPNNRFGDRLLVVTGSELISYDLETKAKEASLSIPGASSVAIVPAASKAYVGTSNGAVYSVALDQLDALRLHLQGAAMPTPQKLGDGVSFAVWRLYADSNIVIAISQDGELASVDPTSGVVTGRTSLAGASEIASYGTVAATLVGLTGSVKDPAAEAALIRDNVPGIDLNNLQAQLAAGTSGTSSEPAGREFALTGIHPNTDQAARIAALVNEGKLPGVTVQYSLPKILVAAADGLVTMEGRHLSEPTVQPVQGTAKSIAFSNDGAKAYIAAGPFVDVLIVNHGPDNNPTSMSLDRALRMPGPVERVFFDNGNRVVQALGRTPDGKGWTSYAIESSGDSVFSDAVLPFEPVAWAPDVTSTMPNVDREALLVLDATGKVASIDIGQFAFGWRIVGAVFGVFMIACLYLLTRILFRRRTVGLLVAAFALADGMLFVQSRIAMNDTYVGAWLLAAYALFALLWTGAWRRWLAFWLGMPLVGVCLGLALASKWVALYAIASIGMLILFRSALGRVIVVAALAVGTGVLGFLALSETPYLHGADFQPIFYALLVFAGAIAIGTLLLARQFRATPDRVLVAIVGGVATAAAIGLALLYSPPAAQNGGPNFTFFVIMLIVTCVAAAVVAYRPIAWSREEMWFAIVVGAIAGIGVTLFGLRQHSTAMLFVGPLLVVGPAAAFVVFGRAGFGPLAPPAPAGDPSLFADPPAAAAPTWFRLGSGFGLPAIWMVGCLLVLPVAIYIASYIPWAEPWQPQTEQAIADNHGYHLPVLVCFKYDPVNTDTCIDGWPATHDGQTLTQLTQAMYNYHNDLRSPHPASSPWWAWPMDLKPVWFESQGYAEQTKSMIYDGGNLPMWWLGIPAMAFLAWQAFRRRSLALTLIGVAFFWQWLSWSRIDRASFQYHFYTALPFYLMALAYFVAELWHGPSRRTWLLARVAAVGVALGAPFLWLIRYPLCGLARVGVGPGVSDEYWRNLSCGNGDIGSVTLDTRIFGIAAVVALGFIALVFVLRRVERQQAEYGYEGWGWLGQLAAPVVVAGILLLVIGAVVPPGQALISVPSLTTSLIGLLEFPIGLLVAWMAITARDPRRFTLCVLVVAVIAFVALYPNLSALPLPGDNKSLNLADFYNGILPTWFYGFQFGVNEEASVQVQLISVNSILLAVGVLAVASVIAYAAWVRRVVVGYRRQRQLEEPEGEPEPRPTLP